MSKSDRGSLLTDIEPRILSLRNRKVILDSDLAELYGVPTKALNQAVKRNPDRFPSDFHFQLTQDEKREVVTNCDHLVRLKFSKTLPHAFTEHGALMAASVLNSPRAVDVSIFVIRAFVMLRDQLASHKEIKVRLDELERKVASHDGALQALVAGIRQLMASPPDSPKRRIGFRGKSNPE